MPQEEHEQPAHDERGRHQDAQPHPPLVPVQGQRHDEGGPADLKRIYLGEGGTVPEGAQRDMERRNARTAAPGSVRGLAFDRRVEVADLSDPDRQYRSPEFRKAHPTACAWVRVSLPGYSRDGAQAVVDAVWGPSRARRATAAALLAKAGGRWRVKWCLPLNYW